MATNKPPPPPRRRRSSSTQRVVQGTWSVRLGDGTFLKDAEGISEGDAWDKFIHHHGEADLLRGQTVVASRNDRSPVINRQRTT